MTREYKRWIFTKACDFAPDGTLRLGQILSKAKDPAHVLQPSGPLELPKDMIIEHLTRERLDMQTHDELLGQFGVWAKLGYVPAFLKSKAAMTRSHDYVWHFDKLESYTTSPTLAYVKDAMRHGDVPDTLREHLFKWRVYMVTGVRVARGARMQRKDQSSINAQASGEVANQDQAVAVGGEANIQKKTTDSEEFDKSSDFVFAYRLNQIRYRGTVRHKPFRGGETSSTGASRVGTESEIVIDDFEVLSIDDAPVGNGPTDLEIVPVPGFEDLECYILKDTE